MSSLAGNVAATQGATQEAAILVCNTGSDTDGGLFRLNHASLPHMHWSCRTAWQAEDVMSRPSPNQLMATRGDGIIKPLIVF